MATVSKIISESGSLSTRTLVTTISAPGIKQNAEISVSPDLDESKISYTINEAAETIIVTLTNVKYTSHESQTPYYRFTGSYSETVGNTIYLTCYYEGGHSYTKSFPEGTWDSCSPGVTGLPEVTYYFNYTVTVTYSTKTFPEFKVRQGGQLKTASDGWVRVNGQLKQVQQIWVRANGQLKEV